MDIEKIKYLHDRFLSGIISQSEMIEWKEAVDDVSNEAVILSLVEQTWNQIPDELLSEADPEKSASILDQILNQQKRQSKTVKLWIRLSIAAAILVIVSSTAIWFSTSKQGKDTIASTASNIVPGKIGGTLTLANGKKIRLSDFPKTELAEEPGVKIYKNERNQLVYELVDNRAAKALNTLSTAYGETQEIILPDGSKVWLNAASRMTYSNKIKDSGFRKVKLEGEAYFEVAKDRTAPFIVETSTTQIEVIGTHFNVKSYQEEPSAKTTLIEGKIKLSTKYGQQKVLEPGQQAITSEKQIVVNRENPESAIAWKDNKFMFESAPIEEVMRMIQRWYNVEVIYEGEIPSNRFGGSVSKFENVSKVLEILESTKKVHFKIIGRRILVSK